MSADTNGKTQRGQPESLRLRMIAPGLTVGDLDVSLAWYRDVLGFTVAHLWEHEGEVMGADLVAGSAHLMIGKDDWAKGRDRKKGEGLRLHFVTGQDVDELAAAIESRGGTLESQPQDMPWGSRSFSIVDPDGFKISFTGED